MGAHAPNNAAEDDSWAFLVESTPIAEQRATTRTRAADHYVWCRECLAFLKVRVDEYENWAQRLGSAVAAEFLLLMVTRRCSEHPILWNVVKTLGIPLQWKTWSSTAKLQHAYNVAVQTELEETLPGNAYSTWHCGTERPTALGTVNEVAEGEDSTTHSLVGVSSNDGARTLRVAATAAAAAAAPTRGCDNGQTPVGSSTLHLQTLCHANLSLLQQSFTMPLSPPPGLETMPHTDMMTIQPSTKSRRQRQRKGRYIDKHCFTYHW